MSEKSSQFSITKVTPAYWRITFSNPPLNLLNPETILELQAIVSWVESDAELRVAVFDSAHPDFFMARYDVSRAVETPVQPGPTGLPTWIDLTTCLSQAPVVSIAAVRGRVRGGGSELTLACDLRFASIEKAVFGQPEVPAGMLPGGGATERLPLLTGRARALEIIIGGDDFDAAIAERYGWINRALPDSELDDFVDTFSRRVASFDKQAIAEAKRLVNRHSLPAEADLLEAQAAFLEATRSPAVRARSLRARERAKAVGADFELRLGHHLGTL